MPEPNLKDRILRHASNENTIPLHPPLARFMGSLQGGIVLSQLLYWTARSNGRHSLPDGAVAKSDRELGDECCISRRQVQTVKNALKESDWCDVGTEYFSGSPTTCYQLDVRALEEAFKASDAADAVVDNSPATARNETPTARNVTVHCTKRDNGLHESGQCNTETTTEPTTNNPPTPAREGEKGCDVDNWDWEAALSWLPEDDRRNAETIQDVGKRLLATGVNHETDDTELTRRLVRIAYGEGAFDRLNETAKRGVVDVVSDFRGRKWTLPIAAVTIGAILDGGDRVTAPHIRKIGQRMLQDSPAGRRRTADTNRNKPSRGAESGQWVGDGVATSGDGAPKHHADPFADEQGRNPSFNSDRASNRTAPSKNDVIEFARRNDLNKGAAATYHDKHHPHWTDHNGDRIRNWKSYFRSWLKHRSRTEQAGGAGRGWDRELKMPEWEKNLTLADVQSSGDGQPQPSEGSEEASMAKDWR